MYDITRRDLDPLRLAALPHRGPYDQISRAFQQVAAVFTAQGLWDAAQGMVGVWYDDVASVPPQDLRSAAGIIVPAGFAMPEALTEVTVAGGPHAVLTLRGPYTGLRAAYEHLYGVWLPGSGEDLADAPPFERYLNDPGEVAPEDLLTEICVPLKSPLAG